MLCYLLCNVLVISNCIYNDGINVCATQVAVTLMMVSTHAATSKRIKASSYRRLNWQTVVKKSFCDNLVVDWTIRSEAIKARLMARLKQKSKQTMAVATQMMKDVFDECDDEDDEIEEK